MSDPLKCEGKVNLTISPVVPSTTPLKYAKVHSPKMKSVYWKYFGFPSNENDSIITKQNIVCTLCHKVLTNHGNTTNLRAHLQHRHKEIFNRICEEYCIIIPPPRKIKKENTDDLRTPTQYRVRPYSERTQQQRNIKVEYQINNDEIMNERGGGMYGVDQDHEEQEMLYESMVPVTYEDDEMVDGDNFVKVEVGASPTPGGSHGAHIAPAARNNQVSGMTSQKRMNAAAANQYRIDVIEEMDPYQLQETIVNMLVQDLRNVDSLYEAGMMKLLRALSGNVNIPSEIKIEALIKEQHSDKFTTLTDAIKTHTHLKPFSLGFDLWCNVEGKQFLSIYFNYNSDKSYSYLLNPMLCTVEYNKYTHVEGIFEEFNLQNCSAALVNYVEDDFLKQFLSTKNIPIILSFDVTIDKCLKQVCELPAVTTVIEEMKDIIMKYALEINSKEVEVPVLNDNFPWTYYELFKFFCENIAWPDDVDVLVNTSKTIADILEILSVTLETLKGEEFPHCSMLSPITNTVLNKKMNAVETDEELVSQIKSIISAELQKLVVANDQLTIAALLDPRFHRLTNVKNYKTCLDILTKKHKSICENEGISDSEQVEQEVASKPKLPTTTKNVKKSNLELFFDLQPTPAPKVQQESNVENDLKRYRHEVNASLDESPINWWSRMGNMYSSLRRLAPLYHCVPCVVNMSFKKPLKERIGEYQRRYMLTGNLIDAILFLHHNNQKNAF